jgi:hypothetical protein
MKLQLKFKESASEGARRRVLAKLASQGVPKVEPVFPNSADEYLKLLYAVDTGDDGADLLHALQGEEAVEIAEPAVSRRLASR